MSERVDVVVVGAGVMGAMTAWRAATRGASVLLLEQFEHLHAQGSSHGQTRIFRVSHRDSRYTELAAESIGLWRSLEDQTAAVLLEQSGQLDHGDPAALDEIEASLLRGRWTAERLTPDEASERWPGMAFDRAVLYSPDGGRVFAERSVAAAVHAAVAAGARFQDLTPVEGIEQTDDGAHVHAGGSSWRAGSVVICAGPWLPGLADGLVPLPPLTVTQQQPVHFAIREGLRFPSFIHHSGGGGSLSFGAYGLESPGEGVKVGIESTIRTVTTSTRTFVEDPAVTAAARDYAERWLPGADTSRHTAATCLFTETEDGHFVLERHGAVVVCSPCSGHGFKFAPVIGDRAARLALGDDAVPPLPQGL